MRRSLDIFRLERDAAPGAKGKGRPS
jgi:hypothetical protein